MKTTTKILTTVLFSAACFAPAAAISIANGGLDTPEPWGPETAAVAAPEAPVAPQTVVVDEVVIVAEAPRKATKAPRKAVRRCVTRDTEIHAGRVQICDKARTGNGKAGLWAPVPKPRLLASWDVRRPSGI